MKILARILSIAAVALGFAFSAQAEWPEKPVKIVVPFPPGNASDVAMRIVGEKLSSQLGQPVIVENRAGAGGAIGLAYAAKQPADGYTLAQGSTGPLAIGPALHAADLHYDPIKDFQVVAAIAWAPQLLIVRKDLPVSSFQEFLAYARQPGRQLRYGSAGNGTTAHLLQSQLLSQTGIKADHIPYQGGGKALVDLIGGQLDFMSDNIPIVQAAVNSGQVKVIGVASDERLALMPDIPTLAEQGVENFDLEGWILVVAPAQTPAAVAARLGSAADAVMKMPDVRKRLNDLGLVPMDLPREKLAGFIGSEARKWREVIRQSGAGETVK
jgi:tripartite-type tricarboxylate transporter receptor subunit TctC